MILDRSQIHDDKTLLTPHARSGMMLFDRYMRSMSLEDMFLGQHLFLCLSGPSLVNEDLYALEQRGIITMAVNNAWSVIRPNLWVSVDSPSSFLDAGWKDPSIMKFVPMVSYGRNLRTRNEDGKLVQIDLAPRDCPNVWYFRRNSKFRPETFLHEPSVNWGNDDTYTDSLGIRGKRSVMLAAIRIAFYLGFRRINLLGADFCMQLGARNYAFPQERSASSVKHNMSQYVALNKRFAALDPYFRTYGLDLFNCLKDSGLVEVRHRDFKQCVEEALEHTTGDLNTDGWYDPPPDPSDELDYEAIYERLYQDGYHDNQKDDSWAFAYLWPWVTEHLQFKTVLDIGASYGGLVQRAMDEGYKAVGIEIAEHAVREARELGRDVRPGTATGLPVPDREFDLVISADVFEHLHMRDVEKAIDESIRASKRYVAMKIATSEAKIEKWNEKAGMNLHQTVMPHDAWKHLFLIRATGWRRDPKVIHEVKDMGIFVLELQK